MREDKTRQERQDAHNNGVGYIFVAVLALFGGFMLGGALAPPIHAISFDGLTLIGKKSWIDEYQTLVGSVVASIFAISGAIFAWDIGQRQIKSQIDLAHAEQIATRMFLFRII